MLRLVFLFCFSLTLLLLFLFIYKGRPRIYYTILAAIIAVFFAGGSWILVHQKQYPDLISSEQVIISNPREEIIGNKRYLTASITNISPEYKLTWVTIRIDLTQCDTPDTESCVVVDQSEAIISAQVEPETTIEFTQVFHFSPSIDQKKYKAEINVVGTRAMKYW